MYNYIFAMHYFSEEVMFSHVVGSSAGLHKTTSQISMKLGWKMSLKPE